MSGPKVMSTGNADARAKLLSGRKHELLWKIVFAVFQYLFRKFSLCADERAFPFRVLKGEAQPRPIERFQYPPQSVIVAAGRSLYKNDLYVTDGFILLLVLRDEVTEPAHTLSEFGIGKGDVLDSEASERGDETFGKELLFSCDRFVSSSLSDS